MIVRLAVVLVACLALVSPALASEQAPTLAELESEVYCPTCQTPLALSTSPIADRMRAVIREWIAAGDSKSEIKAKLVEQFGERVLAAPPKRGFNLIAWVLPIVGIAIAAALLGYAAWRWTKAGRKDEPGEDVSPMAERPLDPELSRRLDEELARFDP
jgi:cytochrome c-type biogenesis protein CcmH